MSSEGIRTSDLVVRHHGTARPAVSGLSFEVRPGEIHGLVGPNGAGKTSTLRVLAGLAAQTSGTVVIDGLDVADGRGPIRARVGFLADDFGVPHGVTCRELVELFAVLTGVPAGGRRRAVERALSLAGLDDAASEPAESLSRGWLQRLGLARVLVGDPPVLVLDEPASGLDPRARVELRARLRELAERGKTILVSSHVLKDLASSCDGLTVLERGRRVFSGTLSGALELARTTSPAAVLVGVLEGPERIVEELLETEDDVAIGERGSVRVTLGYRSNADPALLEREVARISRRLSSAGLRLTHVELEAMGLERAFFALTEGAVA